MRLPFIESVRPQRPIDEGTHWYWAIWSDLGSERPIGFGGAGPIPVTRINEYLEQNGICGEEADFLRSAIRKADGIYLEDAARSAGRKLKN